MRKNKVKILKNKDKSPVSGISEEMALKRCLERVVGTLCNAG